MNDGFRFLRNFLKDPVRLGAVSPASRRLADAVGVTTKRAAKGMMSIDGFPLRGIHPDRTHCGTIVELGAGTGSLTHYIRDLSPVVVERDREWAALLKRRYPTLEIRAECATVALAGIRKPTGVVSSIPLLNNPQASEIKRLIRDKYSQGLIRFCVVYTYGWSNPLAKVGFVEARRERFVLRNLPPAFVWVFR